MGVPGRNDVGCRESLLVINFRETEVYSLLCCGQAGYPAGIRQQKVGAWEDMYMLVNCD